MPTAYYATSLRCEMPCGAHQLIPRSFGTYRGRSATCRSSWTALTGPINRNPGAPCLLASRHKAHTLRSLLRSARRMGWVPSLLPGSQTLRVSDGWRSYAPKSHMAVVLPCSSARGEDAAVMRTFFTHVETAAPLPGGVFLEIGGYNGVTESQSWVLEGCLGWQGVLVEANPTSFRALRAARPASLNIHMAACATAGSLNFSQKSTTMAKIRSSHDRKSGDGPSEQMVPVPCAPLGPVLTELGVDAIDFLSVDVEGVETLVLRSLVTSAQSLTLGVVLVEVRGDGQRRGIMELLLGVGMRYVGCIFGRPSPTNEVISDCFVNVSHLASRFPASRALKIRRRTGLRMHTSSPSPAKSKWAARTIIDGYDLADTSCPSVPQTWYKTCGQPNMVRTKDGCFTRG